MKSLWRIVLIGGLIATLAAAALGSRPPAAHAQAGCGELIQNGGFETSAAWILGNDPIPPQYVTYAFHTASRSVALGIVQGANKNSYSSVRQQVTLSPMADQVRLSFWFYPKFVNSAPATDWVQLLLLFPDGTNAPLWDSFNTSQTWNQMQFDLSAYRGRTFTVYFNAYNDGQGGTAGMLLDDVSLVSCSGSSGVPAPTACPPVCPTAVAPCLPVCPTAVAPCLPVCPTAVTPCLPACPATPTRTPAPTPSLPACTATGAPCYGTPTSGPALPTVSPIPVTPWPGNCVDIVKNGSFDFGLAAWHPSDDLLPVQLAGSPALSPPAALQLGTRSRQVASYSSVRQYVTVPPGTRAVLQFWTWNWSEPSAGADRQEAILLDSDDAVLAVLWRVLGNEQTWRQAAVDLTPYAGRTVAIYFNVYNDGAGGRTAMALDNVQLLACGRAGPPPGPVTVLPPRTGGLPETLPEPSFYAADVWASAPESPSRTPGTPAALAASSLEPADMTARARTMPGTLPVMTRVALEGTPLPSLTPRPTATATPMSPETTPAPLPLALPQVWSRIVEQASGPACPVTLVILAAIAALIILPRRKP